MWYETVYEVSLRSGEIWPSYTDLYKTNMAAAAILDFDLALPVLSCMKWHVTQNSYVKFRQDRLKFGQVLAVSNNKIWRPPPSWILDFHFRFGLFCWISRKESKYKISSSPVDIKLTYSDFYKTNMAAAAILNFDLVHPVFCWMKWHATRNSCVKFRQDRLIFGRVLAVSKN